MVISDPDKLESKTLVDFVGDFADLHILEVGCGEGRLTWQYAGLAGHVCGIDPNEDRIVAARANMPPELASKVAFSVAGVESYSAEELFDLAIFSWSL